MIRYLCLSSLAGSGAKFVEAHAVQVIGYNNEQEYWLAKNSWGTGFADGGYFKVAFGAAGVCDEARGLIFTPFNPLPPPVDRVQPAQSKPGCYAYRATSWDYVSQVATVFRLAPRNVLLDNVNVIPDPAMLLGGLTLVLCGVGDVPGLPVAAVSGAPGVGGMSQLDALSNIKLAIDRGDVLKSWTRSSGANGGYCNWSGIKCDGNRNVVSVEPEGKLNGVLPDVSALQALPKLVKMNLAENGFQGTLPADWSALNNLQELYLSGNQLSGPVPVDWSKMSNMIDMRLAQNKLSGPLPGQWSAMTKLNTLYVSNNQLSGPLPAEWSRMSNMVDMRLAQNKLSGPLPGQWSAMTKLNTLDVAINQLSGSLPAEWSRMSNMIDLRLQVNKLSGPLPGQWSAMTKLKMLYLSDNGLTGLLPPEWKRLAELQELALSRNKLSGPLPGQWGTMVKLVSLRLGGNQLSGVVPAAQWKGMTSLRFIYLWGSTQLSGCLPAAWKGRVNVPGSKDNNEAVSEPRDAYGPDSGTKITGFCP